MLISGMSMSYNPREDNVVEVIDSLHVKYTQERGHSPTHVAIAQSVTEEERRLIEFGMGLTIASARFRMPMVIVGEENVPDDFKEQGERKSL